jgi:hypothetical protein
MELIGGGVVWVVNGGVRRTLGEEGEDGEKAGTSRNSAMWGRGTGKSDKEESLIPPHT